MTALQHIEALLKQNMGLDAASIGISSIERSVTQRVAARHMKSVEAYADLVASSLAELQLLIDVVIVPETWFFRDREAFATLARFVITEWLPQHKDGLVRLLSIPCSTGEEAYTMAMALSDAGVDLERVHIDALDISPPSLNAAQKGLYWRNSFRGDFLEFRARHFIPSGEGFSINKQIRKPVHFQSGNLLAEGFLADRPAYDFIFCRNLLIYFDQPTQDRAIAVLSRLLHEKGVIFAGPSESGLLMRHEFESAKAPLAFAFRRRAPASAEIPVARPRRPAPAAKPARPVAKPQHVPTPKSPPIVFSPPLSAEDPLAKAARLADEGHLAEAARTCEAHLRQHGPGAQAFYLLGLVRDAAGETDEAADFYRKALYLEPNHYEALMHASLLSRKRGDSAGASALQQRARRTQEKPVPK